MTADRQWAREYQTLLSSFIEALGGEQRITPLQRSMAGNAATLQTELGQLQSRFASGRGASVEDVSLFLKITNEVNELLKTLGRDRPTMTVQEPASGGAVAKLREILEAHVRVNREERRAEEAQGIFHDVDGRVCAVRCQRASLPAPWHC